MSETLSKLADDLFESVKGFLGRRLEPFDVRLKALEERKPEKGDPGKDADAKAIAEEVMGKITKALDAISPPTNGKDADMQAVGRMIVDEVAKIPRPENGKDADPLLVQALVRSEVFEAVSKIRVPEDGESVDPLVVRGMVEAEVGSVLKAEVARAVEGLPKPKDGKDADLVEVEHLVAAEVAKAVSAIPTPKNGDPGKSVTLDEVRPVLDGELAKWMLDFERRAGETLRHAIDRMPRPQDGVDGLGLEDLSMEEKDDRTIVFVFRRGAKEKRFEYTLPVLIDRGTFKAGEVYERGDAFTYGGSLFIAQRDTLPTERPEDGSGAFRLAVKRGRDGGS